MYHVPFEIFVYFVGRHSVSLLHCRRYTDLFGSNNLRRPFIIVYYIARGPAAADQSCVDIIL